MIHVLSPGGRSSGDSEDILAASGGDRKAAIFQTATLLGVWCWLYRVVPEHNRLELGKTWFGAPYRRIRINTAAKYLMLKHAFETILANRVEFNSDAGMSGRNAP